MSEIKRIKIQNLIESQIPEFLNEESPLFQEFLNQYYTSQEYTTGLNDLAINLNQYKGIENFNAETFYNLSSNVLSFDNEISVNSTFGFPSSYGLLKIDNEIITYTGTEQNYITGICTISVGSTIAYVSGIDSLYVGRPFNIPSLNKSFNIVSISPTFVTLSNIIIENANVLGYASTTPYAFNVNRPQFTGCVRGFSGIDANSDHSELVFKSTSVEEHSLGSKVFNLNLLFFSEIFKKFKSQYLLGFEDRKFYSQINLQNILTRAKDFYASKGTDTSYKLLFKVLYGKDISIVDPKNFTIKLSDNPALVTKNIVVEKISGVGNPINLIGKTISQTIPGGRTASAAIYNVEYRKTDNRDLYEISLDSESFIYNFVPTKKTNTVEVIGITSTAITVDSTVGFAYSGSVYIKPANSSTFIPISYQNRSVNQFLDVSGINIEVPFNSDIIENNFAYSTLDNGNILKFRLFNIIDTIDYSETSNLRVGDKIYLSSFGENYQDSPEYNSWMYNLPTYHNISNINGNTITTVDNVLLYIGDNIVLSDSINSPLPVSVHSIISKNRFTVSGTLPNNNYNRFQKILNKSELNPDITSRIQNTYIDTSTDNIVVLSSGLPDYKDIKDGLDNREVGLTTTGAGTSIFSTTESHYFYTGEKIHFTPSLGFTGLSTGTYFVNRYPDNSVSLAYSYSNLYANNYIGIQTSVSGIGTIGTIVKLGYEGKNDSILEHQKLLKTFNANNKNNEDTTLSKNTIGKSLGLLINGVELYSPAIFNEGYYYGRINDIAISNSGKDYDVINAPTIEISDEEGQGTGAKVYANMRGTVRAIQVISPGIGYQVKPKISIIGGNGYGAVLESNLVQSPIISYFLGSSISSNVITFTGTHKFQDTEQVIYQNNSNPALLGLTNNSIYYVGVINSTQIKLYQNRADSINKTNAIVIGNNDTGIYSLTTVDIKNTITEVYVKESGKNYSTKIVKLPSSEYIDDTTVGISTFDNYILVKNHNLREKDIVVYSTTATVISGLSTTNQYIVSVIDNNKFRLAEAVPTDFYYNYTNNRFVNLNSTGSGTHTFKYPPIQVVVETTSKISSTTISPVFTPIVLGEFESLFIENYGTNYGSSDIINFNRRPNVKIQTPSREALLNPIILEGRIVGVQILSGGAGYGEDIDIAITGSGKYALLIPTVENGRITNVSVVNSGVGYVNKKTSLQIIKRGNSAKFIANLTKWTLNQYEKYSDKINEFELAGEGVLIPSNNVKKTLQYINFYPPKKLRDEVGDTSATTSPSPILGWAYDGNPVYGPYANLASSPSRSRVKSSYQLVVDTTSDIRPARSAGDFIEDYKYIPNSGDLDEHNGMFVQTKEFPKGTYAYFTTLNASDDPEYPYVIATEFKNTPITKNFNGYVNQDLNLDSINFIRNTGPYYLNSENSGYLPISKIEPKYKQEFIVNNIIKSGIDSIGIVSPGDNFMVGDKLQFENIPNTISPSCSVSSINGVPLTNITVGISTLKNVIFKNKNNIITGITTIPHNLLSNDIVVISSVSSNQYSSLEGSKTISVSQKTTGLTVGILSSINTGVSTAIFVNDVSEFNTDDYIQIDSEVLKIRDIKINQSQLFVDRSNDGGIHTAGISLVKLLPTKFTFNEPKFNANLQGDFVVYFNPSNSIGLGTTGTTYVDYGNTTYFAPSQSIYIKNHKYYTGQPLTYNVGIGGTGLVVYNSPTSSQFKLIESQTVYAVNYGANFVGLSTLGFTTSTGIGVSYNSLYFRDNSNSLGNSHKFTTQYDLISGTTERYTITANTKSPHLLSTTDRIDFKVIPYNTLEVELEYNSTIRKITTPTITFNASTEVDVITSTIYISDNSLQTGDKVVYTNSTNPSIGGLVDNERYFVLRESPNAIKLTQYYDDISKNNYVKLTSGGTGTHSISKVNPVIYLNKGNKYEFIGIGTYIKLYKDSNYLYELEPYKYALFTLDTINQEYPQELYYTLSPLSETPVSLDTDVISGGRIILLENSYDGRYSVIPTSDTSFRLNLKNKPRYLGTINSNNATYSTTSKTAKGPIKTIKVNQRGKFYNKIPKITSILTTSGSGELLTTVSSTIGKVDTLERVKDGFDYPTDGTLLPKLSIPTIAILNKISNVKSIDVLYGGKNYNTPPNLKVIGNDVLQLTTELKGNSVSKVSIIVNDNSLDTPLSIVPVNNSNGFDIIGITTSSTTNSIELDTTSYPLLSGVFLFSVGDEIFIENCSITSDAQKNYNSKDYNYAFFKVTSVNPNTSTIVYDITGLSGFGTYTSENGYGTVVNRKDMATFKMNITDDINYISGEKVIGVNTITKNQTFTGYVMENGWDSKLKQIRINKSEGELSIGYQLKGELSNLKGVITNVNNFNLKSKLGVSRDKINYTQDDIGDLNNSLQKISDNNYYQNFSYAIRGGVPYSDWKEPVHSVIHPSGYREFSDLEVISQASKPVGMKTTTNNEVTLIVKIDNEVSLHTRDNFAIAYDETQLNQSYAERISFGAIEPWNVAGVGLTAIKGIDLVPYILNNTNKVIEIDDISEKFTGTNDEIIIKSNIPVTFNPQYPHNLGVSTAGLLVGDIVGYSTYHTYPENTGITSIGIGSVFTLYPHKSYSGIVTESLSFSRRLNGNIVSGISSFKLTNKTTPLFNRTFNSNDSSIVNLTTYSFNINNHNLQTGQKIFYSHQGGTPIRIVTTNLVLGGISTNILPSTLYVNKINDNSFQVSGLSTSIRFELTNLGIGTHKFTVDNPNANALISIDNIIQKPIYNRPITLGLVSDANVGITSIYVNSGISSISTIDILKIDDELLKIINVGIGSTNVINVKRGFLGTQENDHTSGSNINIIRGDYNIIEDTIFFTSPPQGPTGLEGLKVSSSFSGRVFSRKFDPAYPDDKNIIFDDISDQFTGLSTFTLKENQNNITQIYNNRNYGTDASNNPLIFINNILQIPETDFTIQNSNVNEISYLTGIPNSGKILNVGINTAFGYVPFVGAAATVSVSGLGTISNVYLTGAGTGYRTSPYISLGSTVGQGASIIANVGTSGTITGFTIVNPGSGYTSTAVPIVNIDTPLPYYNLDVEYAPGNSGLGTGAKVSISVASDTSIGSFLLNDPGSLYKVGDTLRVVGLTTNPTVGNLFDEFRLTVNETVSDIFSGYYPGQFIQFNDISNKFNGFEKLFDITTPLNGIDTRITFKVPSGSDLVIENNFFILINGILQVPTVAYRYFAGRIQFTEPPSSGSTCTILFYRGSSSDVEEVTPIQTIKDGDILQSRQNVTSTVTTEQLERVVKRIVQSNTLDTFVYTGYGITNTARPLSWTKQTADRIINDSLISKSRTTLKSNITPSTFLINSVGINDTAIYVNDAFPYFSELDSGPTKLPEFKRNINILDYTSLDTIRYEKLTSVKVKGDYGSIVGINTFTSSPGIQTGRLEFKLKSNTYDNNNLGIGYSSLNTFGINSSQLEIGDYFVISNSNVICGHALTGITESLGGMSNYPNSKVGTARSFIDNGYIIDGVYRVEGVTTANAGVGIVTVSCNFVAVNGGLSVNIAGLSQTTYYGNYSWGKFYDYDNRQLGIPKQFNVNTDDGLIGLSTSSQVSRTVPLLL